MRSTDHRRPEQVLNAIIELQRQLIQDVPEQALLADLHRHLTQLSQSPVVWIGKYQTNGIQLHGASTAETLFITSGPLTIPPVSLQTICLREPFDPQLPGSSPWLQTLWIPLYLGQTPIGGLMMANAEEGYDDTLIQDLAPLGHCASLLLDTLQQRRQQAQEQAQDLQKQARLQSILDTAVDAIITLDAKGTITQANRATERLFGYPLAELLGRNVRCLMPATVAQQHDGYIQRYLAQREAHIIGRGREVLGRRQDGSEFPLYLSVGHREIQGESIFIGILRDMSEQRSLIDRLADSEARLLNSQRFANIGTWEWNIRSGELYWSDQVWPLFGYAPGSVAVSYDHFLQAIHPDDRHAVEQAIERCVHHNDSYDIEHRVRWQDGSIHWLHERGDVVRDEQGTPLRMLGVVQDITQRHLAEAALRQSEHRLQEAQRIAKIGYWNWDLQQGTYQWSAQTHTIFETDPQWFIPTPESTSRFIVDRHGRPRHDALHYRFDPGTPSYSMDLQIITALGHPRWIHIESLVQYDAQQRPVKVEGTLQDITARKQAERELISAREEAEAGSRAKNQFLSQMSHELRTPLNAILGFAQLLELDLVGEQQEQCQTILQAGNHLLSLINDILDLAKIEAGALTLSLEAIDPGELLDECITLITPLAQRQQIRLVPLLTSPHEPLRVRADRTRLKQVLLNLLSNAIKYNRPGGEVQVDFREQQGQWLLQVRDNGLGMTPEQQAQLFQSFVRLHQEQISIEGNGIGLSLSQTLIDKMNGRIDVSSDPSWGSCFQVYLPLHTQAEQPISHDRNSAPATHTDQTSARVIVYVEDNPTNLQLVSTLIQRQSNWRLITASDPLWGLNLIREHTQQVDLVLLDINMPEMDGYELLRHLRRDPTTTNLPIIAVSANAEPNHIRQALAQGFSDYITKPFNLQQFLKTLEHHVREPR